VKTRRKLATLGVAALAFSVTAGLATTDAVAKKKKAKTFSEQLTVGAPIPDDVANAPSVAVLSEINVPKKFKGLKVGDLNLTGLQTTGAVAGAADDLKAKLTAPNGRTVLLFDTFAGGTVANLGPWTLDDDTFISVCFSTAGCSDPTEQLPAPYAGTSNLLNNDDNGHGPGAGPLSVFDGVNMRGTWTLRIWDEGGVGRTSNLIQWGLQIKPLKLKPPTVQTD
jgi:hypothetical protein